MSLAVGDNEVKVRTNRRLFFDALGVAPDRVILGRLIHGRDVSVFRQDDQEGWPVVVGRAVDGAHKMDSMFPSDAVISDVPGLHFLITSADCVPIAFVDRRRKVVGAAHAGWRGTALGISGHVVRVMTREFGTAPDDLEIGIGPSVGPCCYTVKPDVLHEFRANHSAASAIERDGIWTLDLWESNRQQLLEEGVRKDAIEVASLCTSCRTDMFFSHRAEHGRTGRFAMCIGLP